MSDAVRLVVSDVDGTLVGSDKQLTPRTIAAVRRLRDAGIAFTIVSARPRSGMMPIADALDIDLPMGAFNGGTVFGRDGMILCRRRIDPQVMRDMAELIGDAPVDRWLFADDRWYASTDRGRHVASERVSSAQAPIVIDDFASLYDRADKLTLVSDEPGVLADLGKRAAGLTKRATIAQSQSYYLDVTALAANKGDGIAALAEAIGMPLSAVMAIGDQANDVPMFDRAGISVAMGQAPPEVRVRANRSTAGNDADGVAAAIDVLLAT